MSDHASIDASVGKLVGVLTIFDAHLTGGRYVAGDTLTMGDIPIACTVHRWFGLPCEHQPRPNVERWLAEMRSRPAFQGVLKLPIV